MPSGAGPTRLPANTVLNAFTTLASGSQAAICSAADPTPAKSGPDRSGFDGFETSTMVLPLTTGRIASATFSTAVKGTASAAAATGLADASAPVARAASST